MSGWDSPKATNQNFNFEINGRSKHNRGGVLVFVACGYLSIKVEQRFFVGVTIVALCHSHSESL